MSTENRYEIRVGTPESLLSYNTLTSEDSSLIQKLDIQRTFNRQENRIDVFFFSLDGRLLSYVEDIDTYTIVGGLSTEVTNVELNPELDVENAGYTFGDVNVLYNFVNNLYSLANTNVSFFIESISTDRREIRALSNEISSDNIPELTENVKKLLEEESYFEFFRVNFGDGVFPIGINIDSLEYRDEQSVIIRLYEPLPAGINVKDRFTVEDFVGNSVLYIVETSQETAVEDLSIKLKGPNFDIPIAGGNNENTELLNYQDLFNYPVTSSAYELYSLANEKGASISIDYTDFSNFINLSSAEERIKNFYYKASLVEDYNNTITSRGPYTASLNNKLENIIRTFDHYDRFLYYGTGSWSFPKQNSTKPYLLYSTGSTEVQNWYQNIILSASNYDVQNLDRLSYSIPSFIKEDPSNEPYVLFVDMVGQNFDNLWIYAKAITDKYDTDNRLDFGVSKDLVKDVVENFGVRIHDSNKSLNTIFESFIGEEYNTGSESSVTNVTTAINNQIVSKQGYQQEIYKRLYHNLPLLLKSKGTERGVRALINSFGIPSDILKIKTFGGQSLDSTTFYGGDIEYTSSLGKIRITNTDEVVTGDTFTTFTSVVKKGLDYSKDSNKVEIGFSPTENVNNYIKLHPSMSSFDIDDYVGDPRSAFSDKYSGLLKKAETVFTSGSSYVEPYNVKDFVRLIKFFDNSIFRTVKDFIPARANINTGIIIKPHILNRSKIKQPKLNWSNQSSKIYKHSNTELDFTGSEYNSNFIFEGSKEVGSLEGSNPLDSTYTSSYTEQYPLPEGGFSTLIRNNANQAYYTGEFSGSALKSTDGELNNRNPFKRIVSGNFADKDTYDLFNIERSSGLSEKFSFSDYAPLSNNIYKVRGSDKFSADIQESNYSSRAWSDIRYDGSVNREKIDSTFEGTRGNLPFLSLLRTEGTVFESSTDNRVISDIVSNENRPSSTIYYYTLTRPDTGSAFRQLSWNSTAITPELFFENEPTSGSFARTYLVQLEGSNLVKISNKKVFLREANVIETTDKYGKVIRRFTDPSNITPPPQESDEYTVFYFTTPATDSSTSCDRLTTSTKYYYSGSTTSLFVGNTVYTSSLIEGSNFIGNNKWYGVSGVANQSVYYSIKVNDSGKITERALCSAGGGGGAIDTIINDNGGINF